MQTEYTDVEEGEGDIEGVFWVLGVRGIVSRVSGRRVEGDTARPSQECAVSRIWPFRGTHRKRARTSNQSNRNPTLIGSTSSCVIVVWDKMQSNVAARVGRRL